TEPARPCSSRRTIRRWSTRSAAAYSSSRAGASSVTRRPACTRATRRRAISPSVCAPRRDGLRGLSVRLGFFLREALRSMRRSAAPSFAALATVTVTMLVLGVFIPIVQATKGAANSVRSRVLVDVYMKGSATQTDDARVRKELLAIPHVKSVEFVSKDTAYQQQSKQDPQAYALLAANPLPDT